MNILEQMCIVSTGERQKQIPHVMHYLRENSQVLSCKSVNLVTSDQQITELRGKMQKSFAAIQQAIIILYLNLNVITANKLNDAVSFINSIIENTKIDISQMQESSQITQKRLYINTVKDNMSVKDKIKP